jgi:hypothetical protein
MRGEFSVEFIGPIAPSLIANYRNFRKFLHIIAPKISAISISGKFTFHQLLISQPIVNIWCDFDQIISHYFTIIESTWLDIDRWFFWFPINYYLRLIIWDSRELISG